MERSKLKRLVTFALMGDAIAMPEWESKGTALGVCAGFPCWAASREDRTLICPGKVSRTRQGATD
jgi:hypothetical protein